MLGYLASTHRTYSSQLVSKGLIAFQPGQSAQTHVGGCCGVPHADNGLPELLASCRTPQKCRHFRLRMALLQPNAGKRASLAWCSGLRVKIEHYVGGAHYLLSSSGMS